MNIIERMECIVREAASLMDNDFEVTQKDGCANIVTSSDIAVQNFLCERLSEVIPGSAFLCEEEDRHKAAKEYTWIIDPIDGTANYSRGIDQCAICVGLRHGDEITDAVVHLPRTGELFSAVKGQGAYRNGKQIHVSSRPFEDSIMCTALAVYHKESMEICSRVILETFRRCNDIRRFGAAAPELCYIAMGRCELYFEYLLSPWDYAAASLIVSEAGGVLSDLEGNSLPLDRPSGVLGANSVRNLETLQEIVRKQ